jgi:hypothetical protein
MSGEDNGAAAEAQNAVDYAVRGVAAATTQN